jgi:hypothetical protein
MAVQRNRVDVGHARIVAARLYRTAVHDPPSMSHSTSYLWNAGATASCFLVGSVVNFASRLTSFD